MTDSVGPVGAAASSGGDTRAAPRTAASLWRNRPYLLLMSGKTTQVIGEGIGNFAVPLVAFAITHSVLAAGVVTAIGEAGSLLTALPAGVLADRVDRRRLLIGSAAVGTALWSFAAIAGVGGWLTAWQLAVVLFGVAIVTAIFNATDTAALRAVVAPDQLAPAMAAVQGRTAVAALIASPIGGVLYALARAVPFVASALGHAAVVGCTLFVRVPLNADLTRARATHPAAQLREGIRFVAALPLLRTSLWLIMLINLTVNGALIAVNLELVEHHTLPLVIALVDTSAGAAMLVGALLVGRLMKRVPAGRLTIFGLAVLAAAFVGMAAAHSYVGYLVFVAIGCLLLPAVNSAVSGYIAAIVPDTLQGRVSSVSSLGYLAIAPIAPVVAGLLLAQVGIVVTLWLFAAALALGVVGIACTKEVRRIGTPSTWAADAIDWPTPE